MFSTLMHIPSFRLWLNRLFLNGLYMLSVTVCPLPNKKETWSHIPYSCPNEIFPASCAMPSSFILFQNFDIHVCYI